MVAAPALGGLEDAVELLPVVLPVGHARLVGAEEKELRDWGYVRGVPEVRRPVDGHVPGRLGVCGEPVLHEGQHAEREREPQRGVLLASEPGLLHDLRELVEVFRVEVAGKRDDVQLAVHLRGCELQVAVEQAVGDEPRAVPEVVDDLLRDLVGEGPRVAVEGKEVPEAADGEHEGEHTAPHHAYDPPAHHPPVRDQIAGHGGRERAGRHRQYAVRLHERGRGERGRDREDRHESHRAVEYPLHEPWDLAESLVAGEQRRDEREGREDRDEHPAGRQVVEAQLVGRAAKRFGNVDPEEAERQGHGRDRHDHEHEQRQVRLLAAVDRGQHDKRQVEGQERDEDGRVAEPEGDHRAQRWREQPVKALRPVQERQRQRERQERPGEVEHLRLEVRRRRPDGRRHHEHQCRDNARDVRKPFAIRQRLLAAHAPPDERRHEAEERGDGYGAADGRDEVAGPKDRREHRHQRV